MASSWETKKSCGISTHLVPTSPLADVPEQEEVVILIMSSSRLDCIYKMIDDDEVKMKVVMDSCLYKTRDGRFGLSIAKLAVDTCEPNKQSKTFSFV